MSACQQCWVETVDMILSIMIMEARGTLFFACRPSVIAAASGIQNQNELCAGDVICCPTVLTTPDSPRSSLPPPASPNAGTAFWTDWGMGPRAGFISGIVFVVCLFIAAAVLYASTQRRRYMRSQRFERHISSRSSGGWQAADYQSKAGASMPPSLAASCTVPCRNMD